MKKNTYNSHWRLKLISVISSVIVALTGTAAQANTTSSSSKSLTTGQQQALLSQLEMRNSKSYQNNIITGGQPSKKDLALLAKNGVTTVINFRSKGEFSEFNEQATVESLGMSYVSLPVSGINDINKTSINTFHQQLNNKSGSVFAHCASSNRVGAFFALEAYYYQKKSLEQSLAIGKKTGLKSLENMVVSMIKQNPDKL